MDIQKVLELHKMWLNNKKRGERADLSDTTLVGVSLSYADLRCADLRRADLRRANLNGADLSGADLVEADLRGAQLLGANLSDAELGRTDLRCAKLNHVNLSGATLCCANLSGADLDWSSYPISWKGLHWHIDDKQGIQFLYHAISNILYSKNTSDELKKSVSVLVDVCNKFHRVNECGLLEGVK